MILPLPDRVAFQLIQYFTEPADRLYDDEDDVSEDEDSRPVLSFSCIMGYVSALKDAYRCAKIKMSAQLSEDIESLLTGLACF